jgi:hypothetical protein
MKKTLLIIAVLVGLGSSSCSKPGCTDIDATNYSEKAKKDDGSCTYSEKVIFWQDAATSQLLVNAGITGLKLYIDGQLIGSCLSSVYWTGAPSCSQSGNFNVQIDMGLNTSKLITYEIQDNNGTVLVTNDYLVTTGGCNVISM